MENTNTTPKIIELNANQRSILITIMTDEICRGQGVLNKMKKIAADVSGMFPALGSITNTLGDIKEYKEVEHDLAKLTEARNLILSNDTYSAESLAWVATKFKFNKESAEKDLERQKANGGVTEILADQVEMFSKFTAVYGAF